MFEPVFFQLLKKRKKRENMDNKKEGAIEIIAAIIVLFSAMLDPMVSLILSVAALRCSEILQDTQK